MKGKTDKIKKEMHFPRYILYFVTIIKMIYLPQFLK